MLAGGSFFLGKDDNLQEALGGEGVRLHLYLGAGNAVEKRALADIGISTDKEGARVGID